MAAPSFGCEGGQVMCDVMMTTVLLESLYSMTTWRFVDRTAVRSCSVFG